MPEDGKKYGDYEKIVPSEEYLTEDEKWMINENEVDEFGEVIEHGFLGPRTGRSDKR